MGPRFQLAPSVTLQQRADGGFELCNGADLRFPVSAAQVGVLEAFRRPCAVDELAPEGPTREALKRMAADLQEKLVLVEVGQSADREMQLVWNYLSKGPVERAVFHIDNESRSLDDFARSGVEAVRALEALVPLNRELRVATIGCGMGRIEKALAPHVHHVTAFDISDQMLARAKVYLDGVPNITFAHTDGSLATLEAGSVDLVASFLVFQHATREATWRYLEEAARVLRHGGRLVFQLHCYPDGVTAPEVASGVERYYGAGKVTYREHEVRTQLDHVGFDVDLFRDGAATGDERRLTGTAGPWRSVLVRARRLAQD
jgi:SAM-dependent methyltransferase